MTTVLSPARKRKRAARRFAKTVRILSVAPFPAFILFLILYLKGGIIANLAQFFTAVSGICIVPLLAYPLQKVLPPFKYRGREGQRTLAMIMSNIGYIGALVIALAFKFSTDLTIVLLTYVLSGALLLIINKVFHFKASGHACGLAGPLGVIIYHTGAAGLILGITAFVLVLWSSIKLHSHTLPQFIVGAAVPNLIFYTIMFILSL